MKCHREGKVSLPWANTQMPPHRQRTVCPGGQCLSSAEPSSLSRKQRGGAGLQCEFALPVGGPPLQEAHSCGRRGGSKERAVGQMPFSAAGCMTFGRFLKLTPTSGSSGDKKG